MNSEDDTSGDPKRPLLFPDVDYPRQPNNPYTTSDPVKIQVTSQNGSREIDLSTWDDEAVTKLSSKMRPSGDLCDCLSMLRRPLGLRDPYVRTLALNNSRNNHKPFGVIWFVRDPCGIICIIFTWFLILYAEFVIGTVILPRSPSTFFAWLNGAIYHFLTFMAVVSHFKAFATDPGTIPIGNATRSALSYITEVCGDKYPTVIRCPKCMCIKPPRAHHCRICYRCVRKMDHHCPWVNNCVGEANQKYFVLFTLYICLQSLFAIYICLHFVIECVNSDWEACQLDSHSSGLLSWMFVDYTPFAMCAFIIALLLEAFVFGLFTLIMCTSQIHSIMYDETGIESLTRGSSKTEVRSKCKNLAITCGSPMTWRWINPFTPPPAITPIFPGLGGTGQDFIPADCDFLATRSTIIDVDPAQSRDSVQPGMTESLHSRNGQVLYL